MTAAALSGSNGTPSQPSGEPQTQVDVFAPDCGLTPRLVFLAFVVFNILLLPADVLHSHLAPVWRKAVRGGGSSRGPALPPAEQAKAADSVGAVFITYRTPRAFVDSLALYRAAYPDGDIVMMADAGGYDFSYAATKLDAVIVQPTGPLSTKRRGSVYVTRKEAGFLCSSMYAALQHVRVMWHREEFDVAAAEAALLVAAGSNGSWTITRDDFPRTLTATRRLQRIEEPVPSPAAGGTSDDAATAAAASPPGGAQPPPPPAHRQRAGE